MTDLELTDLVAAFASENGHTDLEALCDAVAAGETDISAIRRAIDDDRTDVTDYSGLADYVACRGRRRSVTLVDHTARTWRPPVVACRHVDAHPATSQARIAESRATTMELPQLERAS